MRRIYKNVGVVVLMVSRTIAELRDAYTLWVTGCTVNDIPREPKPSYSHEFSTFLQGFMFGQMKPEDFDAVTARLRHERSGSEAD
jgi:hypothetical protein